MISIRGLPKSEEERLDAKFATGEYKFTCFICGKPIRKWVQRSSGWLDGFWGKCRKCGSVGVRDVHNTCRPRGLGDSIFDALARLFRKDIEKTRLEGYCLLVDQCRHCQEEPEEE